MARNKTIKILRTTRANLNTQKNASGLLEGEPYLITDENRLAIGTAVNNYEDFAKKSETDAKKTDNVSATSRILGRKTAGAGAIEELTLSEVLEFIGSAAQGDILYRGASAWARLPKGSDGQVLTLANGLPSWAAASGGVTILRAVKTADESLVSSSTYQDDDHLTLSIEANSNYIVELHLLIYQFFSTAGLKLKFIAPIGATLEGGSLSHASSDSPQLDSYHHSNLEVIDGGFNKEAYSWLQFYYKGVLFNEQNSGTFKLQWAQVTSNNNTTKLKKGSSLKLTKV